MRVPPAKAPLGAPAIEPPGEVYLMMAAAQERDARPLAQMPALETDIDPSQNGGLSYEDAVDAHIKQHKPSPGDEFNVKGPTDTRRFRYLGPESGGRKDWINVPKPKKDLVS